MNQQAKHGRISPAAATKFFAALRTANKQADRGIELLYLAAYPRRDLARMLVRESKTLLTRIEAELDRLDRMEGKTPPPRHSTVQGGAELHV
jgi:hypothetical protein